MRASFVAIGWACVLVLASATRVRADEPAPVKTATVDQDGVTHFAPLTVPFSSFASDEAKRAYLKAIARTEAGGFDPGADVATLRAQTNAALTPLLDRAIALYRVKIETKSIAGVATAIITPKDGVAARNRDRVLINLHGGGFMAGGGGVGGEVEGAPIAGLGKIKVITIDYRQGPEYKFPAASEDVARVYQYLLTQYKPKNIGIYGCSAGGLLTAESVAWLRRKKLPTPGAIGIFCASASGWYGGDSTYLASPFSEAKPPRLTPHFTVSDVAYFSDADSNDPLVFPIRSAATLASFPPTLILTGSRDVAMSAAIHTHAELVKQGVDAELHVWDGLGHGFFMDPDLPESKEAYSVIVAFFDRHLGR